MRLEPRAEAQLESGNSFSGYVQNMGFFYLVAVPVPTQRNMASQINQHERFAYM